MTIDLADDTFDDRKSRVRTLEAIARPAERLTQWMTIILADELEQVDGRMGYTRTFELRTLAAELLAEIKGFDT